MDPTGEIGIDFVIVGAQRGGSTFFADLAGQHPEVFIPALELPVFEDRFYAQWDGPALDRFLEPGRGKVVGIKRPDSLGGAGVAANIAARYPKARIVAVLRDPVQRLLSAAHWYMYTRLIPVQDLDTIARKLQRAEEHWQDDGAGADPYVQLLRYGAYAWCLDRYRREFPPESIYLTFNDRLHDRQQREQELGSFWRYLGLEPYGPIREERARSNAAIYELRRLAFLSRRPVTFNWESQPRLRYVRRRHLHHPVRATVNAGFQLIDRALLRRLWTEQTPRIGRETEQWLIDFYRPDVQALADLTSLPPRWARRYLDRE